MTVFALAASLNPWLLAPTTAFILAYLALEPEEPTPPWIELSFLTVGTVCSLVFFYYLLPRGRRTLKRRLRQGAFLIGALLLWQSLVAYYPYLYRECPQRWKLLNWAFGQGTYACPAPSRHHISLKYVLDCTADFLGSITTLLVIPFFVLYRRLFGGGWLSPLAWLYWALLYLTLYITGYWYIGGNIGDLTKTLVDKLL